MKIEFDLTKSERNRLQRNLPFDLASDFDWGGAIYAEDARFPYPELRFGYLGSRIHVVCFMPIKGRRSDHQLSQGKRSRGKAL